MDKRVDFVDELERFALENLYHKETAFSHYVQNGTKSFPKKGILCQNDPRQHNVHLRIQEMK